MSERAHRAEWFKRSAAAIRKVITASVGNQSAATPVVISDSDANVLLSFEPQMSYGLVIYSSPEVVSGETYTVSAGTANGQVTAK